MDSMIPQDWDGYPRPENHNSRADLEAQEPAGRQAMVL